MRTLDTKSFIGLLAASLLVGCATARGVEAEPEAARDANARMTFTPSQKNRDNRLAIEVELTDAGPQVVGATVVRTPPPTNSGLQELRVKVLSGAEVTSEYMIADPRRVEIEGRNEETIGPVRVTLYAPLRPPPTAIEIETVGKATVSKPGRAEVIEVARRACSQRTDVAECRAMMQPPR